MHTHTHCWLYQTKYNNLYTRQTPTHTCRGQWSVTPSRVAGHAKVSRHQNGWITPRAHTPVKWFPGLSYTPSTPTYPSSLFSWPPRDHCYFNEALCHCLTADAPVQTHNTHALDTTFRSYLQCWFEVCKCCLLEVFFVVFFFFRFEFSGSVCSDNLIIFIRLSLKTLSFQLLSTGKLEVLDYYAKLL